MESNLLKTRLNNNCNSNTLYCQFKVSICNSKVGVRISLLQIVIYNPSSKILYSKKKKKSWFLNFEPHVILVLILPNITYSSSTPHTLKVIMF